MLLTVVFLWGGNIAYNDNKVVSLYWTDKLYLDEQSIVPNYEVGKSYDMIYGLHSLGINPLTGYPVFLTPEGVESKVRNHSQGMILLL